MCGVCGIYEYARGIEVSDDLVARMLGTIRHRGPDESGLHVDGEVGLGSCRLSIIDVAGGRQPIANEDGTIVVVLNGEIYNYRSLARDLRQRGHVFTTATDTEVIVHLYEERGEDLLDQLRGMFGFAVWDARRRRLFLARDRLGIKPLYYANQNGRLVFGSEIKAILEHPEIEPQLNYEALSHYISLKYAPAPGTMFQGIASLPPAHALVCDERGIRERRYWQLAFARDTRRRTDESLLADELEQRLRESIELHVISDVPVGALLSGGVDSSLVTALMSEQLGERVKTFSVGFEGADEAVSELPYARLVARHCGTDHHEVLIRPNDLETLLEKVVWHLDQPVADEACLANYMVAELASRHLKVVLAGEGGDELFAGYARYAGERVAPLVQRVPWLVRGVSFALAPVPQLRRPKLALHALSQRDELRRLTSWFPLFNDELKTQLFGDALRRRREHASPATVFAAELAHADVTDQLSRMLYVDTKLWLADDLLARGDKMSMAASVEARVPLLDHPLVEFAASLPPHLKLHRLKRKYLLKQVAARHLPPEIITRKKKGFPMPFSAWFRNDAKTLVRDLLSESSVKERGLFDPRFVDQLLTAHETGRADHSPLIWGLVCLEVWQRLFLDARPSRVATAAVVLATGASEGGRA